MVYIEDSFMCGAFCADLFRMQQSDTGCKPWHGYYEGWRKIRGEHVTFVECLVKCSRHAPTHDKQTLTTSEIANGQATLYTAVMGKSKSW